MPTTKTTYRKKVLAEVEAVPVEFMPLLLQMIRTYRESVLLKPAAESFERGWQEAQAGETITLITIYSKSEQADVAAAEIRAIIVAHDAASAMGTDEGVGP